uniref:CSON012595 protein n=1 Tax=Culicoides sonorensis TaxID=179676 RepID=A0A336M5R1_CULSO
MTPMKTSPKITRIDELKYLLIFLTNFCISIKLHEIRFNSRFKTKLQEFSFNFLVASRRNCVAKMYKI